MATLTAAPGVESTQQRRPNLLRLLMQNYFVRKLFKMVLTVFAVTTFIFFLIRLLPGNPVDVYVNQLVDQQGMTLEQARSQATGHLLRVLRLAPF